MKKILFAVLISLSSVLSCFSLPNIKLYENTELKYIIKNDKIYDKDDVLLYDYSAGKLYYPETDSFAGTTISEKDNLLIFEEYLIEKLWRHYEFDLSSGYMILHKLYLFGGSVIVSDYDEKSGLWIKKTWYSKDKLENYEIYEYDKGSCVLSKRYNADGTLDNYTRYSYDKKTKKLVKEEFYNSSDKLVSMNEYDAITGHPNIKYDYSETGSIKAKTLYDGSSWSPVKRFIYTSSSGNPVVRYFVKFDSDYKYELGDGFYLEKYKFERYELENLAKISNGGYVDYKEKFLIRARKCDFNTSKDGYKLIKNLIDKGLLCSGDFALCNRQSNYYYYFSVTDDDEIDVSSCYEIELIKKQIDYPAMNKSGKGKGPFGFDIGMTYEEVKVACGGSNPEYISDDRYYVIPKKAHPLFEKYIVWISDEVGLYYIKGVSRDIKCSDYGTEVKDKFDEILLILEKKYGKFEKDDSVKSDYLWKDERDWMTALKDGARTYSASWYNDNTNLFDGLYSIGMGVHISDQYSTANAYIWIEYGFQNYEDAQEAVDDVL